MWTVLSNNPGQVSGQPNSASILLEQYKTVAQPIGQFILQSSERQALPQYCLSVQDGLRLQQTSPFTLRQTGLIIDLPTISYGLTPLMDIPSTRNKRDTVDGGTTASVDKHPYQTSNQPIIRNDVLAFQLDKKDEPSQPPAPVVPLDHPMDKPNIPAVVLPDLQEEEEEELKEIENEEDNAIKALLETFRQIPQLDQSGIDYTQRLQELVQRKEFNDLLDLFNSIPELREEDPELIQYTNRLINLIRRDEELKKIQPASTNQEKAVVRKGLDQVLEKRMNIAEESTTLRQQIVKKLNKIRTDKARQERINRIRLNKSEVMEKKEPVKEELKDEKEEGKKPSKLDSIELIQKFHDQIRGRKGRVTKEQKNRFVQLMERHKPNQTIVGVAGSPLDALSKKSILDQLQALLFELED